MNSYIITYTGNDGSTDSIELIERSESAALKAFKHDQKGSRVEHILLNNVNIQATKQQERETLERIRGMVDDLGPDSYLKTAFTGVMDDADQNIEYDAAFSWHDRAESERERCEAALQQMECAVREKAAAEMALAEATKQLNKRNEEAVIRQHSNELDAEMRTFLAEKTETARDEMFQAADDMAGLASTSQDVDYQSAAERYRLSKARFIQCKQFSARLG